MSEQYGRKATLVLTKGGKNLDLSELHFRFNVKQEDGETPNNAAIRVYNLSDSTMKLIREEFEFVTLQAGYKDNFGVIFQGSIRQLGIGKETAVDKYLEIFAADGDTAYNFTIIRHTLAAGWTQSDAITAAAKAMEEKGVTLGDFNPAGELGGTRPSPRGKVMFGMPKIMLRTSVASLGASWHIQNGKINIIPLDSYLPGQAVELTSATGLVGLPEQTNDGMRLRCLINPRITVGGLVKIDNKSINQLLTQPLAPQSTAYIPYNKLKDVQTIAALNADGLYRVYAAEYEGDTRGQAWYCDIIGLAINQATEKVVRPNG